MGNFKPTLEKQILDNLALDCKAIIWALSKLNDTGITPLNTKTKDELERSISFVLTDFKHLCDASIISFETLMQYTESSLEITQC